MPPRRWFLVVLVGLFLPPPARAAPETVFATGDRGANIAVDDAGSAFLVTQSRRRGRVLRVRPAPFGATSASVTTLMRTGRADRVVGAGVAADGGGVIVMQRAGHRRVRAVAFGAGGSVGRPFTISAGAGRADFAASAVARSGAAVVVWFRHRADGRWRLEAAVRAPGAAAFGAPEPLSAFVRRPCCTSVSVGIGDRGDAAATWRSTARSSVWVAVRVAGGAFGRPQRVAADASDAPRVVVGAGGAAALLYSTEHVPQRGGDGLQLHRAAPGRAFGAAEHLDPGGGTTTGAAAVTPAGHVVAAWVDRATRHVRVSEADPGAPLVAAGELGTMAVPEALAVTADDDGRAVVAWSGQVPAPPVPLEQAVAALRRQRDAPFSAPEVLGVPWRAAEALTARLPPGGGALVVWRGSRFVGPADRRTVLAVTRLA